MEGWIRNFAGINQQHPDMSDYEKFFTHAKRYLEGAPSIHSEVSRMMVDTLGTFKNKTLISIAYRLLCSMNCDPEIPSSILRRHFRDKQLRKYVFPVILKLDLKMFDPKLLRLLYDPHYECKGFFRLMETRRSWLLDFLDSRDKSLSRKQMMVMIHTKTFHNLDYFLGFFGSEDRSLSFLAFEMFKLFLGSLKHDVQHIERMGLDANSPNTLYSGSLFTVLYDATRIWISLNSVLEVESPTNFLIHFSDFAADRDVLQECVVNNDMDRVGSILGRYIVASKPLVIPDRRWIIPYTEVRECQKSYDQEEVCFEYLFSGCCYKDITDCIEI